MIPKMGDFCTPKNQLFWIVLVAILDQIFGSEKLVSD
jgi:hypothetical protein